MKGRKTPKAKRAVVTNRPRPLIVRLEDLIPLALEVYGVLCRAMTLHGLPAKKQMGIFKQALSGKPVQHSGTLLEQFQQLGDLLTTWLEDLPYVDPNGRPRVLPIRGRGATFESLARQFMPEKPLSEVIELACRAASVGTLPGGRIAVYGDPMVDLASNPEAALAQMISHVTQVINTCRHNVESKRGATAPRRLERMVAQIVTAAQFEVFEKAIRPLLDNLCQQADRLLKQKSGKLTRGRARAGIGVYVYFDDSSKVTRSRAGARTRRRIPRKRR